MATRSGPGLRLQIVLALAGVILVAYVPLFFALAEMTRATSLAYREEGARGLGRAIAAHLADVKRHDPEALSRTMSLHVGEGGAIAAVVFDRDGAVEASAGPASEVFALKPPKRPYGEAVARAPTAHGGRVLDVVVPTGESAVVVRIRTEEDAGHGGALVRGIALYMSVFALALLVIAYIALTRGIVRPIEGLARAADRVASGARGLELPDAAGAREIVELGRSVRSMATKLLSDEEALRKKVEELTTTTRRLGETRAQLEGSERMASVGKLAAGVAHEIGNPIAAIMGMHDLLDDAEMASEERADFLRRMRKETERINVVVRDLLDYARPEQGPQTSRPGSAALEEVVSDVLALVRPQKGWREIETTVDLEPKLRVSLSPQRLTQVLLNILLNAGAALGGRGKIAIAAKAADPWVAITVTDDGPGVSADVAARIFDPFVTTKEVGEGTGLGLAVCRGIVEGANGRIWLDESYAEGARFVVELPSVSSSQSES